MIYENFIRVLNIDLTTGKLSVDQRADLVPYLGGVGVAAKLLEENLRPELAPLDPNQPLVFAIGAASYVYPVVTKTVAMFVSPLTGELGESYAGGRLAMTLFMAGYDAVVIRGKATRRSYIAITRNTVDIKDARVIWGMSSDDVGRILREREPGGGKRSIIRIGPAGENGIHYASACVDTYRHFGRLGLGAVLGSKNIKAITVIGDQNIPARRFAGYFKVFQDLYKQVTDTEIMAKYHDVGTPINVIPLDHLGALPTRNLTQNRFENVEEISGETFATRNLTRKMACTGCPVGCIHIGQFKREFGKGYEYEAVSVAYDYELIFALGSFIGVKSSDEVLQLIEVVERMGMDAISTGVVLGWATEAFLRGIVTTEQTVVPLEFGNTANYAAAIEMIARPKNEFYAALAKGADHAAGQYGGKDFAMTFAKNEMPGYHTGYGSVVGATVGARHSHLCNAGYAVDQSMKGFDKQAMVQELYDEEIERCMLNSLIICLFSRKVYTRPTVINMLNAIGYNLTNDDLTAIAERIYLTKLRIKKALGFDLIQVKLPKRLFETDSMSGKLDEQTAYELIEMYNQKVNALLGKDIGPT